MVSCGNQSYVVRSAHGLLAALALKMILDRRWLYSSGMSLYSRPCACLYLHARSKVYSRPRAERGGEKAQRFRPEDLYFLYT